MISLFNSKIHSQLQLLTNWPLLNNKELILQSLERHIYTDEVVTFIIGGFFKIDNSHISIDSGIPGICIITTQKIMFLKTLDSNRNVFIMNIVDIQKIMCSSASILKLEFASEAKTILISISNPQMDWQQCKDYIKHFAHQHNIQLLFKHNDVGRLQISSESPRRINSTIVSAVKHILGIINEYKHNIEQPFFLSIIIEDIGILFSHILQIIRTPSEEQKIYIMLIVFNLKQHLVQDKQLLVDVLKDDIISIRNRRLILARWQLVFNSFRRSDIEHSSMLRSIKELQKDNKDRELKRLMHCYKNITGTFMTLSQVNMEYERLLESTINKLIHGTKAHKTTISKHDRTNQQRNHQNIDIHSTDQLSTSTTTEESLQDVLDEINNLIGMKEVKKQIKTLVKLIEVQNERKRRGLADTVISKHIVFYGPPGTGKTTVARYLGKVYKCLGLLKSGHLIETDRAGLVAGYVGQTAIQVDEIVKSALDGVLFIDEAYSLVRENDHADFGQEAVDTLITRMEDYRDRLVIIVAGYSDEMKRFIKSNPGLQSRFSRYFTFYDYSPQELLSIFMIFTKKGSLDLTEQAEQTLLSLFNQLYTRRAKGFGNGRLARNIFELIIEKQANRIANVHNISDAELCQVTDDDIPSVNEVSLAM